MSRPREFEIDVAIEKAMNVFWTHGYDGTKLPDLLNGMGIARGSLYKAFGSKKELFLRALDLYDHKHVQPAVIILKDGNVPGDVRISNVFAGALKPAGTGDRRGCLLCNTAASTSSEDPEVALIVNNQLDRMTKAFAVALADTTAFSGLSERERMAEANNLTLQYVGLRVMTRGGQELKALESATDQTLSRLR